jgi:outer membrane lipoprotein-sorting protein
MKKIVFYILFITLFLPFLLKAQTAEEIIQQVKAKLEKVKDYEAKGTLKTNVTFIKVPVASVKIYFKNPDKLKIKNESGISFVPKGSVNLNMGNIFSKTSDYDIIDAGKENKTGLRIIKLLPREDQSDIVLSTLYIDEKRSLIKKAKTTTKENGTYELEMTYGKYAAHGLADKVIFTFNIKEYKLPKGVTFDYDDGTQKKKEIKDEKGRVEISYSEYKINIGVPDSVFQ